MTGPRLPSARLLLSYTSVGESRAGAASRGEGPGVSRGPASPTACCPAAPATSSRGTSGSRSARC
ncbi:hypothetical protein C5C82_16795, partial [Rathayibacter sp. AY1D5]